MEYTIYTDGSALRRAEGYFGGWALYCVETKYQESGNKALTTNNEMELTAIARAVDYCLELKKTDEVATFTIVTDSNYSLNSVTKWSHTWSKNGWVTSSNTPVLNVELIKGIFEKLRFAKYIKFKKVKAHCGETYNELVDKEATRQSKSVLVEYMKEREVEKDGKYS